MRDNLDRLQFEEQTFRILIVDDKPENIEVLSSSLSLFGYNIAVANSGIKALSIIERVRPDLILLDVMMPGIDGYETCRRLKENVSTRDIPVIFITARTSHDDINHGLQLGAVDYVSKPFNDKEINNRVRTHLSLMYANKQLQKLNEQKDKFLEVAAHDLRNPLGVVSGYVDLLQNSGDELDKSTRNEFYQLIKQASQVMRNLISDFLDVDVIAHGKISVDMKVNDIVALVQARCDVSRIIAEKKRVAITVDNNSCIMCLFDKDRIGQIMDKLLTNAIKYSPVESEIEVKIESTKNFVCVEVIDQGPGLTDDDLEKIFVTNQCLGDKSVAEETITGLGLVISKRVIDAHKGDISVTNNPGGGARFSFILPLQN